MIFRKAFAVFLCVVMSFVCSSVSYAGELENNTKDEHLYIPILMYHHFAREILPRGLSGATITTDKFKTDMNYLSLNGYTALLPKDLKAIREGSMELPEKPVVITMDDGYESAYSIAYPILKQTGMKATVFVIVGSVEHRLNSEIQKLNWKQMKEMYDSGVFDIQSHSYNLHNRNFQGRYMQNDFNGIQKGLIESHAQYILRVGTDIGKSVDIIEKNVGNDVTCFSYPYGLYEKEVKEIFDENGILFGFGTRYGAGDLKGNQYYLNRFAVGMKTDLKQLLEQ